MKTLRVAALALLVVAAPVFAQVVEDVNNPSGVQFTASPDHATIDSYELQILRPDGSPLQTLNLGKPAPDANDVVTATLSVQPIQFGVGYMMRVRAKAGTAVSTWADAVNKFNRVPGPPSKFTIK